MKTNSVVYQFVDFIPERIESGVLYISQRYGTAMHKCCCGCGEEVVTPLNPTDWSFRIEGDLVTLHPSIGNWSFSCKSHYWIRKGKVIWASHMSMQQIQHSRSIDHSVKQAYFEKLNSQKSHPVKPASPTYRNKQDEFFQSMWANFKRWLGI